MKAQFPLPLRFRLVAVLLAGDRKITDTHEVDRDV